MSILQGFRQWRQAKREAPRGCPRCAWLRVAPAADLVLFWNPVDDSDGTVEGERVRVQALALHAAIDHDDNLTDRLAFTHLLRAAKPNRVGR